MINGKRVLAIIPARGGSKGVPGKNIRELGGVPLIGHSIVAAKKADYITDLIVSTDSEEIKSVSEKFEVDVPFLRPAELASDTALSIDVVLHALGFMEKAKQVEYDYVMLLQPTTPFRTAEDIDRAISKAVQSKCDSIVSMVDVGANHPARMYTIEDDQIVSIYDEGVAMQARQKLPPVYIRSGDIYLTTRSNVLGRSSMIGLDTRPIVMDPNRAVNIDSFLDFKIAEFVFESLEQKGANS